jgi:sterol desaturase/sphingolipid hydroxylase (fatty acid hydroxylase superfamily)
MLFGCNFSRSTIVKRGAHLDRLTPLDVAFITFNRLTTTLFTMHLLQYADKHSETLVSWRASPDGLLPTLVRVFCALPLLYIVYDFFYAIFHKVLHHRWVYRYVHKHHHRQHAPSRGNADAVNVHPFEFVSGEYNHLLACYIVGRTIMPVPFASIIIFVALGGFLASLNHTRYDIKFPYFNGVYQVKFHDLHHWYPDANFSQYTPFWDHVFGW